MGVLVIGGGITGLAAARSLATAGLDVTLLEAAPRLGGKVATERADGFLLEHGPDSFLATRPAAVMLARDLGLGDELVGTKDPRAVYIRHRGTLVPMPEGLGLVLPTKVRPFVRTRLFSWPEKVRMAKDLLAPRMLGPDDIAVGTYLRRRLGSPLVDRLAGPLVGGVYGTPIDELSLDAVVPQLRAAETEHRSLLRAGLADGRKQREMAARRPPGTKSAGVFQTLGSGLGTLVEALGTSITEAGADVRTGVAVRSLNRAGARVAVRLVGGELERYDGAVLAVPSPVAARLLDGEIPGATRALQAIPHGTSILVTLAYPRAAVGRELFGHGYLVPPTEGGAISACTWSSEKWAGRAPDDAVLLRMFVRDEGTWTSLPETELVAAARADAETTLAISGDPLLVRVSRWTGAMPRYTVGHLDRATAVEAAVSAWPAVTVAGASYRGVGLPDCITQGNAAASRMLAWLAGGPGTEAAAEPAQA